MSVWKKIKLKDSLLKAAGKIDFYFQALEDKKLEIKKKTISSRKAQNLLYKTKLGIENLFIVSATAI